MSSSRSTIQSRVQVQWLVLGAALIVLAGLVVGWALTDAADRVDVVAVARPVPAGDVFDIDDLRISQVAFDGQVTGLVPASSVTNLVGRVATIDLEPGTLLTSGMWADDTGLAPGERTVGALLGPGRTPDGLSRGDTALAVSIVGRGAAASVVIDDVSTTTDGVFAVRVLDAEPSETGGLAVTLAVPEADAPTVARLAATDALVLVGVPSAAPASPADDGAIGGSPESDESDASDPITGDGTVAP